MMITKLGEPFPVMYSQDGKHDYFAWPTVARLRDGRLAATCSGFRTAHIDPFGKACISYSSDEGETWTPPTPVIDTPLDDRDSGVVPFGENGVIVTSFNNTVAQQRIWNPDNAYYNAYLDTVTPEEEAKYLGPTYRVSFDGGVTFSPVYHCPVTSPHGPCVLHDGTILWVGRAFSETDAYMGDEDGVRVWKITTDGKSEYMGKIEDVRFPGRDVLPCEPHAIELPDGTILCHIRVERTDKGDNIFTTYESRSTDGGHTWTKPRALLGITGGAPAHLMLHSSGVLVSVYGYRNPPYGIRVMVSRDLGKTWETDLNLYDNHVSLDLGYPASVELRDGTILTVFYAHPTADEPAIILGQKWRLEE